MQSYTQYEKDLKANAIEIFLKLVMSENKSLGDKLAENKDIVFDHVIHTIQYIGIHDYADRVLNSRSPERFELNLLLKTRGIIMSLSAKELRAIGWYVKDQGYRPLLSTPPKMYFRDDKGKIVTEDLSLIVVLYDEWSEEDKKRRELEKKMAKARYAAKKNV